MEQRSVVPLRKRSTNSTTPIPTSTTNTAKVKTEPKSKMCPDKLTYTNKTIGNARLPDTKIKRG